MQQKEKSSINKIGGGLSPITRGRYQADFNRTTQEIAYHIEIRDSVKDPETKTIQQEIIDKRIKHLAKLEEKLRDNQN